jgi:hypothetical protein
VVLFVQFDRFFFLLFLAVGMIQWSGSNVLVCVAALEFPCRTCFVML